MNISKTTLFCMLMGITVDAIGTAVSTAINVSDNIVQGAASIYSGVAKPVSSTVKELSDKTLKIMLVMAGYKAATDFVKDIAND